MTDLLSSDPSLALDRPARVDITAAFDRLRVLASTPHPAAEVMDGLSGILVPAVADRCVVDLIAAPVLPIAFTATGRAALVTVRGAASISVSFASAVDDRLQGAVSCAWNGGYQPSDGDVAVIQAIVGQAVLLTDCALLSASVEQLQAHTGQLRDAMESNRRIGAAIGVLMARYGLTEDGAFEALRRTSNTKNRKLREIAEEVLYTGVLPEERTVSPAHRPGG